MPAVKGISIARPADVDAILRIQKYHKYPEKRKAIGERIQETGFLVHTMPRRELARLISDRERTIFAVSRANGRVNGYFLAYDMKKWVEEHLGWVGNVRASRGVFKIIGGKSPSIYLRHLAINSKEGGRGQPLEEEVFRRAKARGYVHAFGGVLEKPYFNYAQFSTLRDRGYEKVGEVAETIKGRKFVWALVWKKI